VSRLIKYFFNGLKEGMIIGVPDFSQNSFAQDKQNIKNDFDVSYKRIIIGKNKKATKAYKTTK